MIRKFKLFGVMAVAAPALTAFGASAAQAAPAFHVDTHREQTTTQEFTASSGITYLQAGSNCGGGEGHFTNGTMKGSATVKADVGSTTTQQGLFIS